MSVDFIKSELMQELAHIRIAKSMNSVDFFLPHILIITLLGITYFVGYCHTRFRYDKSTR